MSRILPVTYELNYTIEFEKAIRGHHISKNTWLPSIGQNLESKTGTPEEAIEYDKNVIGVFKSGDKVTLAGHLPIEISCLLTYFLKAAPGNKIDAIVAGKRKMELGLAVLVKYVPFTKNKTFANILLKKLQKKKKTHSNFEFNTITTVQKIMRQKCKIVDAI